MTLCPQDRKHFRGVDQKDQRDSTFFDQRSFRSPTETGDGRVDGLIRDQENQSISHFVSSVYLGRVGPLGSNPRGVLPAMQSAGAFRQQIYVTKLLWP